MKDNFFKGLCIVAICIAVVGISIAYAALSQTLKISASGTIQNSKSSWNVHFQEKAGSKTCVTSGYAEGGTITVNGTTATITNAKLKAPGDSVTCTFQVINEGDITAKVSTYTAPKLSLAGPSSASPSPSSVNSDFSYTITYGGTTLDSGTVASLPTLAKGATQDIVVKLSYSDASTALPTEDITVSLTDATLVYTQAEKSA